MFVPFRGALPGEWCVETHPAWYQYMDTVSTTEHARQARERTRMKPFAQSG